MKALIIGATGATGECLVSELLADEAYQQVVIFVRRPTGRKHDKLVEYAVDMFKPEAYAHLLSGDVFFSCLGTTLKAAGSNENQWKIDFEIPAKFAEIAKQNKVSTCVIVSAYGASKDSRIFYSRMKGELEERIVRLAFNQTVIFQPGILKRPGTDRMGEKVAVKAIEFFNRLGILRSPRPSPTELLAQKLAKAPKLKSGGLRYVKKDEIFAF